MTKKNKKLLDDVNTKYKELSDKNTKYNDNLSIEVKNKMEEIEDEIKKSNNKALDDKIKSITYYYDGSTQFTLAITLCNNHQYIDGYCAFILSLLNFLTSGYDISEQICNGIANIEICVNSAKNQTYSELRANDIVRKKETKKLDKYFGNIINFSSKNLTIEQKKKLMEQDNIIKEIMKKNNLLDDMPTATKEESTSPDK